MSDDTTIAQRAESEPPWPSYALPRGTTVNGYQIERILGSGGFGITYLARDLLKQRFAVKEYYPRQFAARQDNMTVRPSTVEDTPLFDECRDRFLREAEALVMLGRAAGSREGIVRVQTYFEAYGTCFLVMDYVEGESLANVLRRERTGLSAERLRSLLAQLLSSVGIVHKAGLLHRDIKPANIILRDGERLVLIDFGATRQATPSEATTYTQIYSGGYGPPEQMLGLPQGAFSDIYAVGAVCYRAIGGNLVDALARQNSLAAGRADPQKRASEVGAGRYPARLLTAIDAALEVDARRRPQSIEAMLDLLGPDALAERRTEAAVAPGASAVRRRHAAIWSSAAASIALIVAGGGYLVTRQSAPPAPVAVLHTPQPASATPPGSPTPASPPATQQPAAAPPIRQPQAPPQPSSQQAVVEQPVTVPPAPPLPPTPLQPATKSPPPPAAQPPEPAPPVQHLLPAARQPSQQAVVEPPVTAPPAPPPPPTPLQAAANSPPPPAAQPPEPAPPVQHPLPAARQPSQEAVVVPPVTAPPLAAPPTPLERAQAAASVLPCSALRAGGDNGAIRLSGFAGTGAEIDRLLGDIRTDSRVVDNVTRVGQFACPVITAFAPALRRAADEFSPQLVIRVAQPTVAYGSRTVINVVTGLRMVYLDVYEPDGTVHHLLQPAGPNAPRRTSAELLATSPPGPRLVIAIGAPAPLDIGRRSAVEQEATYLELLRSQLADDSTGVTASLTMVTFRAPEPPAARPTASRPASARSEKCANIVSRAQLGETLSDGELATLRAECRP